jgi:hypothetical protein
MDRAAFDHLPNTLLTDAEYLYNVRADQYLSQSIHSQLASQGHLGRIDSKTMFRVHYSYDAKAKLDIALEEKQAPTSTRSRRTESDAVAQNPNRQYKPGDMSLLMNVFFQYQWALTIIHIGRAGHSSAGNWNLRSMGVNRLMDVRSLSLPNRGIQIHLKLFIS